MADFLYTKSSSDLGRLILRVAVGGLLLFHGISKMSTGVAWIQQAVGSFGLPGWVAYGVYVGEILAPILLIIGIKARMAAVFIVIDMVAAVAIARRDAVLTLNERGGGWSIELEALFFFGALALFFMGAGRYRLAQTHGFGD